MAKRSCASRNIAAFRVEGKKRRKYYFLESRKYYFAEFFFYLSFGNFGKFKFNFIT